MSLVRALRRAPVAELGAVVASVWVSPRAPGGARREHVLPTGRMHLVVRLGRPVGIVDGGITRWIGSAVVGGARATFYEKESEPAVAVGAELLPFASLALFGVPADELAERHTRLDDLWGVEARRLAARLGDTLADIDPSEAALAVLEAALLDRLHHAGSRSFPPALVSLVRHFDPEVPIAEHVARSGLSHRVFVARFRAAIGLAPKEYAGVLRFQRSLDALADPARSHADAALDAGYADQPHYCRDLVRRAGVTPEGYRASPRAGKNHVLVG